MIIIFINDDDNDDDDGYGDFSFFHIVYIHFYLIRMPKCVNIPSIISWYND